MDDAAFIGMRIGWSFAGVPEKWRRPGCPAAS
jgi:hypothetical protein